MFDTVLALAAGIFTFVLVLYLWYFAAYPYLYKSLAMKDGPWLVERDGCEYLAFNSPQEYTFVINLGSAHTFTSRKDADDWAKLTEGYVVPYSRRSNWKPS